MEDETEITAETVETIAEAVEETEQEVAAVLYATHEALHRQSLRIDALESVVNEHSERLENADKSEETKEVAPEKKEGPEQDKKLEEVSPAPVEISRNRKYRRL